MRRRETIAIAVGLLWAMTPAYGGARAWAEPASVAAAGESPAQGPDTGGERSEAKRGSGQNDQQSEVETQAPPPKQEAPKELEFRFGLTGWFTQGQTQWSHNASMVNPLLGNPTSELQYEDSGTPVVELEGQVTLAARWFVRGNFGYGTIGSGDLTDDDYISGPQLLSQTVSDLDGDNLWYVNLDLGLTALRFPDGKGALNVFLGYQHWQERLVATGVTQVECAAVGTFCNPVGTVSNVGQPAITNTAQWDSLRVGVDARYAILTRISLNGELVLIPYTSLNNEDIHHLRTDLQQDPSFSMRGTGYGVNVGAGATFHLTTHLALEAGYRAWWLRVEDGEWQNYPVAAPSVTVPLTKFESWRYGFTLGVNYLF